MSRRSPLKWALWLAGRWLLLGGVSAIIVGLGFGVYIAIFLARSVSAVGKIIRLEPRLNQEDGATNYYPVVTFTAGDGRAYTVISGVGTNPPEFDEGQEVRVLYVKSDPSGARIDGFWQLWTITVVSSGLGFFFAVPGYLLFRWERRRNRPKSTLAVPVEAR